MHSRASRSPRLWRNSSSKMSAFAEAGSARAKRVARVRSEVRRTWQPAVAATGFRAGRELRISCADLSKFDLDLRSENTSIRVPRPFSASAVTNRGFDYIFRNSSNLPKQPRGANRLLFPRSGASAAITARLSCEPSRAWVAARTPRQFRSIPRASCLPEESSCELAIDRAEVREPGADGSLRSPSRSRSDSSPRPQALKPRRKRRK